MTGKDNSYCPLSQIWFAFIWKYASIVVHKILQPYKVKLLQPLYNLTSNDEKLRKHHKIRILEIGIAGGSNLDFYPAGSHFIGVDVNENFRPQIAENLKGRDLVCEKLIYTSAEDLKEIEDNSIDAVISTFVLCYIPDANKAVKEVYRVLTPGGKWFLCEHGKFKNNFIYNTLLRIVKPIIYFFGDGCVADKRMDKIVDSAPFTKNEVLYTPLKLFGLVTAPFVALYIGTLTK